MNFARFGNLVLMLWIALLASGCSSSRLVLDPERPEKVLETAPKDTAILVVAPSTIGRFETFQEYREDPNNVSIIGKAEYQLRLMDIPTTEFPKSEFAAVKSGFAHGPSLEEEEWIRLSESLGQGKPVIYVYGLQTTQDQPTSLKVMDGMYNCTIAPLLFIGQFGPAAYSMTYSSFSDLTHTTVIYTHEVYTRVYSPKEKLLKPALRSQCIVQTEEGRMNRTRIGDVEEYQLQKFFEKIF